MRDDEWVACEDCVHDRTLRTRAAPVDESDETEPGLARGGQVRIHERRNFIGPERVQVEHVFDWDLDRIAGVITHVRLLVYSVQSTSTVASNRPQTEHRSLQTEDRRPKTDRHFFSYVAVTTVLMPPRGVKSPTTVMRVGAHAATRSSRMRLVTLS